LNTLPCQLSLFVHAAFDRVLKGKEESLFSKLKLTKKLTKHSVAVGGGINSDNIGAVREYGPSIVVVGSSLVNAQDPAAVARKMKTALS
ncbi:hypothetical protein LCGC14_2735760, partial [marine sediment metagenome]